MKRLTIPRWLWWTFAWSAGIALGLGYHCELDYRDRVAALPAVVDERGNTAPLETVMAGMDSYERATRVHQLGLASFGVGAGFIVLAATTKRGETQAT